MNIMEKPSFIRTCIKALNIQAYYSNFEKCFELIEANTDELKEQTFKLRYHVYVKENGLSRDIKKTSNMERDIYDKNSVSHLMIHKASGKIAGTVRIVLPDVNNPMHSFPLQKFCDHPFINMEENIPNICQISRLCMSKDFRKRPLDGKFLPEYFDQDFAINNGSKLVYINRKIPYAPLGLMRAAFGTALENNITDCLWALEREQLRVMRKLGLIYRTLGPRINYFGKRQVFVFNIKHALDNMSAENAACEQIVSNKGRLSKIANEINQNKWHDNLFDKNCMNLIFDKINND